MGRLKRYRTAWQRHRRSRGFGVHSPYAYALVTTVLSERLPYYAYEDLEALRRAIVSSAHSRWPHPRVMSLKNAKMLFRIVNHFNPSHLLQVGSHYGLSAASMMSVSSKSRLWLYEPSLDKFPVAADVLRPYLDRIACHDDIQKTIGEYLKALDPGEVPFVLVTDIADDTTERAVRDLLTTVMAGRGVVLLRNLSRCAAIGRLWQHCLAVATHGQTFTNERLALLVSNPKLPLQHFSLWF